MSAKGRPEREPLPARAVRPALAVSLALLLAPIAAAQALERVHTVPTRDGVTETYLEVVHDAAPKKLVAVVFVGGEGLIKLAERAAKGPVRFGRGANFLVRVREPLAGDDVAVEIVDAPSDRQDVGDDDWFRMGERHAADIRAVIDDARKRHPDARVYLVGTSRGTVSAAYVGVALGDTLAGTVLSSSVTVRSRAGAGLSSFDFDKLRIPVLFVHHVDDACPLSPYAGVSALGARHPLVSVKGGDPPQSGPCDPLAPHGYFGVEAPVVAAMRDFIHGQPVPRTIP